MRRRPRIAQVIEATGGGTRRHLCDLVTGLNPERFDLAVLCATRREPGFTADLARFRARGVACEVLPMVRPIRPWTDAVALAGLIRALRRLAPDVVHTHSAKAGFLGRLAARAVRVPFVVHTPHHFPFEMEGPAPVRALYRGLERLAARWADRIVCVCPAEREVALRAQVAPPERLVVIENGVGLAPDRTEDAAALRAELALPAGAPVVVAIGRLSWQKGQDILLRAAPTVLARLPQARFLLVGDGEERPALERQIRACSLQHCVHTTGQTEDVWPYLELADVIALPSRWEALPYALLDGMAAGLAAVASAVGGMPAALAHGEAGVLVPPGDEVALAGALAELLAAPERRRTLGGRARTRVGERYRLEVMLRKLETLYEAGTTRATQH